MKKKLDSAYPCHSIILRLREQLRRAEEKEDAYAAEVKGLKELVVTIKADRHEAYERLRIAFNEGFERLEAKYRNGRGVGDEK